MIFIVSDLHLGKGAKKKDRSLSDDQSLSDLLNCIKAIGSELTEVVFLGDTFDAFIEYKHHIPESVVKWVRAVALIRQMNVNVRIFAGNHDRWHGDHIQSNLHIRVQREPCVVEAGGIRMWMEHGDCAAPNSSLVQFIRYISDRSWALFLFKIGLPFGLGQQLAAFISRTFSSFEPDPVTIEGLKTYAFNVIEKEHVDIVVMGHCHQSCLERSKKGPLNASPSEASNLPPSGAPNTTPAAPKNAIYANTGDWYQSRTFLLVSDSVQLCRWASESLSILQEEIF